jgi:DNA/RNA-binding domain of Phe-tRNA-synthetase-like protein
MRSTYGPHRPGTIGTARDDEHARTCQDCRWRPTRRYAVSTKGKRKWQCASCGAAAERNARKAGAKGFAEGLDRLAKGIAKAVKHRA